MILKSLKFIALILLALFFTACKKEYTPKPHGYFWIDLPEKAYTNSNIDLPYTFEYPVYSELIPDTSNLAEPYWLNVSFPKNNAKIHLSYKTVHNNLDQLTEDSRELVYKHAIKANAINEKSYLNADKKVFGTIYIIKGNVASPLQFHLTDSTKNFIRGSFYIAEIPNFDSLSPVINFIEEDIYHIIETFSWN